MLGAVLFLGLAGCGTPEPAEPTPTPAFSSEAEAFAAAEETYRAYVEAENARRAEPDAPDPQVYLTGPALESDIDSKRRFDELGVQLAGPSEVTRFEPQSSSEDLTRVSAVICLDSTNARVVNQTGTDVTPEDRDATLMLVIGFKLVDGAFLIRDSDIAENESC